MERSVDYWPIFSVNIRKPSIDPKPPYQRGPVWSVAHQQLFIDSILRNFDILNCISANLAAPLTIGKSLMVSNAFEPYGTLCQTFSPYLMILTRFVAAMLQAFASRISHMRLMTNSWATP